MNEIKKDNSEQEAIVRARDAKKRKRILIKVIVGVVIALAVLVAVFLILKNCSGGGETVSYSYDPLSEDWGIGYYEQSLDYDVFSDELYADKDKGVYFYADNVGIYYLPEDRADASYQAQLFIDYFEAAIHGDGKTLNTLFTDDYFKNAGKPIKKYPDRFPMQKIYKINVDKVGNTKTENTVEGTMIYEYYKVSFLIMDNNGRFRPDLPEEQSSIPLIYDVITLKGVSKINRISQIVYNK